MRIIGLDIFLMEGNSTITRAYPIICVNLLRGVE